MVCSWIGERVDDAFAGESLDDVLVYAEFGEGRHDESLSGRRGAVREVGIDPRPSLIHRRGGPDPLPGTCPGYRASPSLAATPVRSVFGA